ncbi:conserved hypothetical protein [Methylocella silvestris BL2]|uniref:DoxX family protein n=1 Tax=Methylocella silvestris (strain DSM 15510 / CIP 108128 / LMG 27833 / NCIMB 13906 / BL2) TaxID=395965 RepID=B8ESI2_METSB|nr:DUF6163 family protein [Methylocella silvestris]ACK49872.1 conserved hypothetical protein [Methylocella silvestris BL2]
MKNFGGSEREAARDGSAAIRIGDAGAQEEKSIWGLILVVFMRVLAALWVFQGLSQWGAILTPREPLFDQVNGLFGAAVIFFAILDLVAAVGLWLATPWGGVLWLFSAIAQIFAALMIPGFFATAWIGVNMILIIAYFALTWRAGRAREDASRRR